MILGCTQRQNAAAAEALAAALGDEVFPLAEQLENGRPCTLFSGRAYVLVADFKTVFSRRFLKNFKKLSLRGSRILYCVFVGASARGAGNSQRFSRTKMYDTLAEALLRSCGLVLFGCECLCDGDEAGLHRAAAYARDARPFDWNGDFPRRAHAAVPAPSKA